MFKKRKNRQNFTVCQIIPPKSGDFEANNFVNILEALDIVDELLSLELSVTRNEVTMYLRSSRLDHIVAALDTRYPQVRFEPVLPEDDPLLMTADGGTNYREVLWPGGEEWLPLLIQNTGGGDPFAEMVGGLSAEIPPGGRLVTRVVLNGLDRSSSEKWRHRALSGSGSANQKTAEAERLKDQQSQAAIQDKAAATQSSDNSVVYLLLSVFAILVYGGTVVGGAFAIWNEHRLEVVVFFLLGIVVLSGLMYVLFRIGFFRIDLFSGPPEPSYYDPEQVKLRVNGAAFRLEVQLYVVLGEAGAGIEAAERALQPVVASYRRFDNPQGDRFKAGPVEELVRLDPTRDDLGFVGVRKNILRREIIGEGIAGTREVAELWHVPGDAVTAPNLVRAGSRRLPTPPEVFTFEDSQKRGAALIGIERYRDGGVRRIYFPSGIMHRHHFYVAKTRTGKSTLMCNVVRALLRDMSAGTSDVSLVVVDPHSDLVTDVLNGMPISVAPDVRLIDMGDSNRAVGLNLLDVHAFPKRDITIPTIISIARASSSENSWGDRMQSIFEWSLIALYEANRHRQPGDQYTIFDVIRMLTDEFRREEIIRESKNREVEQWWHQIYPVVVPYSDRAAIAPVLRKIGEYGGVEAARRVLGQRRCTLDIEDAVMSGKPLLVDTARARSGPEVASIIGASILNVLQEIIQTQGNLPPEERRRIIVVVDEMQSLPGVKFDEMLAELGKYGGSLIMATQSLDRLNSMTDNRAMRETILANVGCLMGFQVNASDAALLRQEMGGARLEEQDFLDIPPYNAYGRLTLHHRNAYFSAELLPPFAANPKLGDLIHGASAAYSRSAEDADREFGGNFDDIGSAAS